MASVDTQTETGLSKEEETRAKAWKQNRMPTDASANRVAPAHETSQKGSSRIQRLTQAAALGKAVKEGNWKELGKQAANQAVKYALNAIAPGAGTAFADEKTRKALMWGILIVLLILLFIILFILNLITGGGAAQQAGQQGNQPTNPLTINKTCTPVPNTSTGQCTVTVNFLYSAKDIIITDTLFQGATILKSDWAKYTTGQDASGNPTVIWKLSDNVSATPSATVGTPATGLYTGPITQTFNFTVQAPQSSWNLSTNAQTVGAVNNAGSSTGYTPPSTDQCQSTIYAKDFAKFQQNHFTARNYGDPLCQLIDPNTKTIKQNDIYNLILKEELTMNNNDPTISKNFATIWFVTILPRESSYDANDWAPPVGSQMVIDSGGAWGLFQMGSSTPAERPPDINNQGTWGKNDFSFTPTDHLILDRGDVNWQMQISNALTYNHKRIKCSFWYWGSYRRYYLGSHPSTSCTYNSPTCVEAQQC